MKEIQLDKELVALVDDEDYENLIQYKWHAWFDGYNWYPASRINGQVKLMHRLITNYAKTDHKNGNGLDNTKANLRPASDLENCRNAKVRNDSLTGFKGVWQITPWKYRACIRVNGKRIHLGYFKTKEEAAASYDKAARIHFGNYATLNFPTVGEQSARR